MRWCGDVFDMVALSKGIEMPLEGRMPFPRPSPASLGPDVPERRETHARTDWTKKFMTVAIRHSGMLYNIPENYEESNQDACIVKAAAGTIGIAPSGCGAVAARQPGRAVQEVRQGKLSLRRRRWARTSLLPLRDARSRKDTIVLRSATAQEPGVPVPAKSPQAAGTSQRNHWAQSGAPGARGARRRGLIQNPWPAFFLWILSVAQCRRRLRLRSRRARRFLNFVAFWPRCYWMH